MNSVADNDIPRGWILCESTSVPGKKYYFNRRSGKSLWTCPQGIDVDSDIIIKAETKEKVIMARGRKNLKRKCSNETVEEGPPKCKPLPQKKSKLDNTENVKTAKVMDKTKQVKFKQHPSQAQKVQNVIVDKPKQVNYKKHPSQIPKPLHNVNTRQSAKKTISETTPTKSCVTKQKRKGRSKKKVLNNSKELSANVESPQVKCRSNKNKAELKSRKESRNSLTKGNNQSMLLPSSNKILSSIVALSPELYTIKKKPIADTDKPVYKKSTSSIPSTSYDGTPSNSVQQTNHLITDLKSKLENKSDTENVPECKVFSSANERMRAMRKSLNDVDSCRNEEKAENHFLNRSDSFLPQLLVREEMMDVDEIKQPTLPQPHVQPVTIHTDSPDVVMVVDTNIFIHELDVITKVLNSHIKGYSDPPKLLVPWRVINELDRLKDGDRSICYKAKKAMDFLYQSLPTNSRIKGQSLREANSHIFPCEMPDDEILNCSLQQAQRGQSVILLTNDKNLCNKGVINSIRSMGIVQLKQLLDDDGDDDDDDDSSYCALHFATKYYQHCIYQLLANILENEMRAKYDTLWEHVLFIAPPWNLLDVLQCLLKHWIAVFSEVFPRIENLLQYFKNEVVRIEQKGLTKLTEFEVTKFRELAIDLARKCQIIPEYMELAKITVMRLNNNTAELKCLDTSSRDEMEVIRAFENIWIIFSSFCAKLSNHLDISHNLEDKMSINDGSLETLRSQSPVFNHQIKTLTLAIRSIITNEPTDFNEHIMTLLFVFNDSVGLFNINADINRSNLTIFCTKCRNMLQEAYTKFSNLTDLLTECSGKLANCT